MPSILLLLALLFPALADASQTISDKLIIYTHDFQPYHYHEQQQLIGINLDLVVMALNKAGIEYEFQPLNWARSVTMLEEQTNTALLSMIKTTKRQPRFQWVGPLVSSYTCLYRLQHREDIQASNLADVRHLTIGVLRGGQTHQMLLSDGFKDGSQLIPLADIRDTYRMLQKGRVDLIPGSPLATPYQLEQVGMSVSQLAEEFCLPESGEANYLALNLGVDRRISERLNKVLNSMRKAGIFKRVTRQYQYQSVTHQ